MKNSFLLGMIICGLSGSLTIGKAQNTLYDESKVPSYSLPPLLQSSNGKQIKSTKEWEKIRRPEILHLFQEHVFGHTPKEKIATKFEVTSVDENALDGKAIRKIITVYLGASQDYTMSILLYLPKSSQRVPVFLGLNYAGNQATHPDAAIPITTHWIPNRSDVKITDNKATETTRGILKRRWPVEEAIERGYGIATVYYGDLQYDKKDGDVQQSIQRLFKSPVKENSWGAIGRWAWGLSKAMDYLVTDRHVDAAKVAVVGHSRLGKAALWAGAQDTRFSLIISNNSGEGGAAITRRLYGETIDVINKNFPHWFSSNYKQYNHKENDLPVDYHQLIALMAPRLVYVASASEDLWADPKGEYLSGYEATPVYQLYGKAGLTSPTPPAVETPVGNGSIGYHSRKGPHDILLYDWQQFMNFADRHWKK